MFENPAKMSSFLRSSFFPSKTPTDELAQRIRSRDWGAAMTRLYYYPADAQYRTENQSTVLHLACLYRAPLELVERVLECFPQAVLLTETEGNTPLHCSILYGCHEDIVLLLLRRGGVPVTAVQSQWVGSPLALACRHGSSIRVLEALVQANPTMATKSSTAGTAKPASLLWHCFTKHPNNRQLMQRLREGEVIDDADEAVMDLLRRLHLLLSAAEGRLFDEFEEETFNDNDKAFLLHRVLMLQSDLDLENFVPLVLKLYPEQARRVNATGHLPLHIALAGAAHGSSRPSGLLLRSVMPPQDPIELLLEVYPRAARILNGDGQLALHIALQRGRAWNVLLALVQAAPEALLTRDVQSRLYPVLLAAAYACEEQDAQSLNTIFELLQASPPVVQHGLQ